MTRRALAWLVIAALAWAGWAQSAADLAAAAEALFSVRHELPNLERLIAIHEELLASEPGNRAHLARLAQLWYEWAVLSPPGQDEVGLRRAAEHGAQSLGLSGLAELQGLTGEALRQVLAETTDPAFILWTAHSWGLLLGKMNPFSAFFALPKIRMLYERVIELDPAYHGGAGLQAYGALLANLSDYGILFGVRLSDAKALFEQAIATDPSYLDNYVAYAREYAVRARDRALFERLLGHVLAAPIGDWPFWNRYAQAKAAEHLSNVDRYFR